MMLNPMMIARRITMGWIVMITGLSLLLMLAVLMSCGCPVMVIRLVLIGQS